MREDKVIDGILPSDVEVGVIAAELQDGTVDDAERIFLFVPELDIRHELPCFRFSAILLALYI